MLTLPTQEPTQQEMAGLREPIATWQERMDKHYSGKKVLCTNVSYFVHRENDDLRTRNAALLALIDAQQKQIAELTEFSRDLHI